ncbi:unnamed protein product [Acanthosepion pharaonis]|uniref:Uncharacterized protein n=1 Tax=Acanthosepion pharaonis TaxID=158019 RepID=A0A812BZY1_ACAPH|nr:unnamed protein product [Sepia pharaonis]
MYSFHVSLFLAIATFSILLNFFFISHFACQKSFHSLSLTTFSSSFNLSLFFPVLLSVFPYFFSFIAFSNLYSFFFFLFLLIYNLFVKHFFVSHLFICKNACLIIASSPALLLAYSFFLSFFPPPTLPGGLKDQAAGICTSLTPTTILSPYNHPKKYNLNNTIIQRLFSLYLPNFPFLLISIASSCLPNAEIIYIFDRRN